jgi:hypothetical protein
MGNVKGLCHRVGQQFTRQTLHHVQRERSPQKKEPLDLALLKRIYAQLLRCLNKSRCRGMFKPLLYSDAKRL